MAVAAAHLRRGSRARGSGSSRRRGPSGRCTADRVLRRDRRRPRLHRQSASPSVAVLPKSQMASCSSGVRVEDALRHAQASAVRFRLLARRVPLARLARASRPNWNSGHAARSDASSLAASMRARHRFQSTTSSDGGGAHQIEALAVDDLHRVEVAAARSGTPGCSPRASGLTGVMRERVDAELVDVAEEAVARVGEDGKASLPSVAVPAAARRQDLPPVAAGGIVGAVVGDDGLVVPEREADEVARLDGRRLGADRRRHVRLEEEAAGSWARSRSRRRDRWGTANSTARRPRWSPASGAACRCRSSARSGGACPLDIQPVVSTSCGTIAVDALDVRRRRP